MIVIVNDKKTEREIIELKTERYYNFKIQVTKSPVLKKKQQQ